MVHLELTKLQLKAHLCWYLSKLTFIIKVGVKTYQLLIRKVN
jgi:hypothetical protein